MIKTIANTLLFVALLLSFPKALDAITPVHFSDEICMGVNLFMEAKGEGKRGMQAVAAVTYNRVKSKKYPDNVCSVVFQRKQFSWTFQQDYATIISLMKGEVSNLNSIDLKSYRLAMQVAKENPKKILDTLPRNVLHYHSTKVKPYWSKKKIQVAKIGQHVFYKE